MDFTDHAVQIRTQLLDIDLLDRRNKDAGRIGPGDPALFQVFERTIFTRGRRQVVRLLLHISISVHLVENQINRFIPGTDIL